MSEVQSLQDAESLIHAVQSNRIIYWFRLPEKLAKQTGVQKLGLIELLAQEELMCATRAGADQVKLGMEMAKEALRHVDDKKLSTADGTIEAFWDATTPGLSKVRQLVLGAYNRVHAPDEGDAEDFLDSMETQIGG